MKNKKIVFATRCSFILFILYVITYIILPIYTHELKYLILLTIPFIFTMSLLINILIKYNNMNVKTISKISKIVAIISILINGLSVGAVSGALYVGTINWEVKQEQIKKYPSIDPAWLFVIIFTTALLYTPLVLIINMDNFNVSITFILISIIILILCQISSSFTLYYNNGKKEMKKFWRNIIIVFTSFIIILSFVFIPLLKDIKNQNSIKKELQRRKNNIYEKMN